MTDCDLCGIMVDLPFRCKNCGFHYCDEHRLMWKHHCVSVESKPERNTKKIGYSIPYRTYKVRYRRSWYIKRFFKWSIIPLAIVLIFIFANPLQLMTNKSVTINEIIQSTDQKGPQNSAKNYTANPATADHPAPVIGSEESLSTLQQVVLDDLNKYRQINGKPVLLMDNHLPSQSWADHLLSENCLHHMDDNGITPTGRFTESGTTEFLVAENVAGGTKAVFENLEHFIQQENYNMMYNDAGPNDDQPGPGGHTANILNPESKYVSIGVAYNSLNMVIVEDFEYPLGPNEQGTPSDYKTTPDQKKCW